MVFDLVFLSLMPVAGIAAIRTAIPRLRKLAGHKLAVSAYGVCLSIAGLLLLNSGWQISICTGCIPFWAYFWAEIGGLTTLLGLTILGLVILNLHGSLVEQSNTRKN